ncbi:2'-5' RNA ligase family protein [Flammeovirga sp. SJP92]|uniref:2'-5' RNA ligase family protein n=1 Tax=Flammeovirga sp. SJP92 TaxID=1775430 RepID=UPI000786FD29|nr:2'-5' RNA ligase family protein [Flammeovirga sp. SJP92]KXX68655.1 hypothetical protein AVL50_23130 [Flammeovirga sp. SJP92]
MKHIALDLVLLPKASCIESIVAYNSKLPDTVLKLGKNKTVPHLSLTMCRVEANRYDDLVGKLQDYLEVLDLSELLSLNVTSIYQHNINTIGWNLALSTPLKHLHYSLSTLMKSYHNDNSAKEENKDFTVIHPHMPFSGVDYLNVFFEEYAFDNYQPHITLGQGDAQVCEEWLMKNIEFDRIALFHMGTGCTCEKLLWETKISNN